MPFFDSIATLKHRKVIAMTNNDWIAPSILSADFSRLGEEVQQVIDAGANLIHFDVMDNHYVPNLTIGPLVCEALSRRNFGVPLDVHLMTRPVDTLVPLFAKAGAAYISFHPEATDHIDRTIDLIRQCGAKPGLAFNPATPLSALEYTLNKLDIVLIMSVNPGFGGQSFIPEMLQKIRNVHSLIIQNNPSIRLEVDGGLKTDNIRSVKEAGADTFVAGSAVFHSKDYKQTIACMRESINSATRTSID